MATKSKRHRRCNLINKKTLTKNPTNRKMKNTKKQTKKLTYPKSIKIADYQKLAMRTCLPSCKNKAYALYGFKAEIGEVFGKVAKKIRGDEITKRDFVEELGDCFWFCALACELEKLKFENVFKYAKEQNLDDVYMDLDFAFDTKDSEISLMPEGYIEAVKAFCKKLNIKPSDCMRANIRKLTNRYNRNVIKGNGDNR